MIQFGLDIQVPSATSMSFHIGPDVVLTTSPIIIRVPRTGILVA